jgi:hypothetical protein
MVIIYCSGKTAMSERKQNNDSSRLQDEMTGKGWGKQGVDKAPGKETAQHKEQVREDTLKGKGKVDGDPSKKSDQPIKDE